MDSKPVNYDEMLMQIKGLTFEEPDLIANMANISSVLYNGMYAVNWAGFYILKNNELVLGPFHGQPACIRIPLGKGVCGHVANTKEAIIVDNVHEFSGHIACDAASNSEIVIPILNSKNDGRDLIAVLDLDSTEYARFSQYDKTFLMKVVDILNKSIANE